MAKTMTMAISILAALRRDANWSSGSLLPRVPPVLRAPFSMGRWPGEMKSTRRSVLRHHPQPVTTTEPPPPPPHTHTHTHPHTPTSPRMFSVLQVFFRWGERKTDRNKERKKKKKKNKKRKENLPAFMKSKKKEGDDEEKQR